MPAKIICFSNQKGGSGKTTTCCQVAGTLGNRGKKVLIIDADPQGTAVRWAASAPDDQPFPATVVGLGAAGSKVHQQVKRFVDDYAFILIDCPPSVESPHTQSALLIADLAICPLIPSPTDLWATTGFQKLVETVQPINEALQARLLATMCQSTTLTKNALEVLETFDIPLLKTRLGLRTAYRQSAAFGSVVVNQGHEARAAAVEINALLDELLQLLEA